MKSDDPLKEAPNREIAVFTAALAVPIQGRAEFLAHACAGDENLRHKVEALLRAHDRAGNFLEEPPTGESNETN